VSRTYQRNLWAPNKPCSRGWFVRWLYQGCLGAHKNPSRGNYHHPSAFALPPFPRSLQTSFHNHTATMYPDEFPSFDINDHHLAESRRWLRCQFRPQQPQLERRWPEPALHGGRRLRKLERLPEASSPRPPPRLPYIRVMGVPPTKVSHAAGTGERYSNSRLTTGYNASFYQGPAASSLPQQETTVHPPFPTYPPVPTLPCGGEAPTTHSSRLPSSLRPRRHPASTNPGQHPYARPQAVPSSDSLGSDSPQQGGPPCPRPTLPCSAPGPAEDVSQLRSNISFEPRAHHP
jgi:hypothetical protein